MQSPLGANQGSYGSALAQPKLPLRRRRRVNYTALAASLVLPVVLFTVTFGALSFSVRYQHAHLCGFILALGVIFVLACSIMAFRAFRQKMAGNTNREPTWYLFLAVTLFVGWVLAVALGCANFAKSMRPYYDVTSLNTYPGVDPAKTHGQQLLDAGRVMFTRDSRLDISKSFGFKNSDTYCVAPITSKMDEKLASYDFWAIGMNCCTGNQPDFHCDGYANPRAHGGLRLMDSSKNEYFQLAVQQAKAAYKIRADNPLFFHWTEDPIGFVNNYQHSGLKNYVMGVLMFFALQLFLVIVFSIRFSHFCSI